MGSAVRHLLVQSCGDQQWSWSDEMIWVSSQSVDILQYRARVAELSGGTSSEGIYSKVERVIVEMGLRGRVLDYGAGIGQLTRRLLALQRFSRIAATDIVRVPSDLAGVAEWTEQDLNLPIPACEDEFDVVVAAEVIEHLENPRFTMREIFRILRPGGTAIVTTPNNESWRSIIALVLRGHHVAFSEGCYPAHITALLRKDFIRIFREAKFDAPLFHFTDQGGIPGKPTISWQQVSFGLLRGLRFSDNILVVAKKPTLAEV
jgi:2-polyprenyl-3-methyl-5-hydroxy-6-metoxy-1,4-benzoquinol methylase